MKKKIISFLVIIALFFNNAGAQTNTFPSTGDAGVGTTTPENSEGWNSTLEVKGASHAKSIVTGGAVTAGLYANSLGAYGAPTIAGIAGTWTNHPFSIITNKQARMTFSTSGYVGIGTTNPLAGLHLKGTGFSSVLLETTSYGQGANTVYTGPSRSYSAGLRDDLGPTGTYAVVDNTAALSRLSISSAGNVGIGTLYPTAKFQVLGGVAVGSANPSPYIGNEHVMEIMSTGTNGNLTLIGGLGSVECWSDMNPTKAISFGAAHPLGTQDGNFHLSFYNNLQWYNDRFFVEGATGNVGVGTSTPTAKLDVAGNIYTNGKILINQANNSSVTPYALAVNGSAIFTKAVVKLNANWPDYVFAKDYQLPTLASIEKYINANNHLPGVASAQEVADKGIDLGDNQAVLLKKVEELTLYLIEMDKEMKQVKKENAEMKETIKKIAEQMP